MRTRDSRMNSQCIYVGRSLALLLWFPRALLQFTTKHSYLLWLQEF